MPPKRRRRSAKPAFKPGVKGQPVDKNTPDYIAALAKAQQGMPPFADITFLEAEMFDNGTARKPGVPRYQIKLGWSCAAPYLIGSGPDRSKRLTHRYIPLAVRQQARDNWNRASRKAGLWQFEPEERVVIDKFMELAREEDAKRKQDHGGKPEALIGCVQHRPFEGTIRHSQFGLILWRSDGPGDGIGAGAWMPMLFLARAFPQMEFMLTFDHEGVEQIAMVMTEGRGAGVVAYGTHYGIEYVRYIRPTWLDAALAANLNRMKKP